jgi:hypothetical protein
MASSVLNLMAFAFPVFRMEKFNVGSIVMSAPFSRASVLPLVFNA